MYRNSFIYHHLQRGMRNCQSLDGLRRILFQAQCYRSNTNEIFPYGKIMMKDILIRMLIVGNLVVTNAIHRNYKYTLNCKSWQELENSAIIFQCRTRTMPELRVITLTDQTVKQIKRKVTAELRLATRGENGFKRFSKEGKPSHPASALPSQRNSLNSQ